MDNETSLFIVRQGNVSAEGLNREPLNIAVPMTLLYSAIFMTGVLGNVMTCSVICQNRVMRTCTNYYLFSLAGSDLLLLVVGMPPEIYSIWSFYPYPFGRFFCRFRSLAAEASTNASVLTIMAFTIERYLAICHPFRAKAVSRPSRAIRVIMLIWVLGFGLALPQALQFDVIQAPYSTKPGDYSVCDIDADKLTPEFFILSFALFFSLPMILITILYIRIALRLNANAAHADISTVRFREYDSIIQLTRSGRISGYPLRLLVRANRRISERKAVIKMLVAVVIAFFICWAPFHAQRMWSIYRGAHKCPFLYYGSGIFYYVSSTINPILYNILSKQFRKAFWISWQHFCVCCRRCKTPNSSRKRGSTSRPSSLGSTPTPFIRVPQSVLTQVSSHYITTTV